MNLINFLAAGVSCGDVEIGGSIVGIIRFIFNGIKIGVPVILIIVGMFDMGKAITQQKEDEIKKAQNLLVRKAVAAALVFLIVSMVGLLFSVVSEEGTDGDVWTCVDKLLSGETTGCTSP